MGFWSASKRLPRSEAAMAEATDLGPITVDLGGHRLTFEDCVWLPEYDADIPATGGEMEQELVQLRRERRKLKKELDKFVSQTQEMKDLKERWNLMDFKYQLLLDMWTMKALDAKKDECASPTSQRHRSPKSRSADRVSPNRHRTGEHHHSPPRERQSPKERRGNHSPRNGHNRD